MNVLVTGVTGFVGRRVVKALLEAGVEVTGVVRPKGDDRGVASSAGLTLIEGDLLRPGGMAEAVRARADICIHAAWYTEPGKYLTSPLNVDLAHGTARFAAALAQDGCPRFIGVGTCFEYDTRAGYLSEETALAPAHVYSAAKVATFYMVRQLLAGTSTSFAWARVFYLYGPNEHANRMVPAVIDALLRGEEARVTPGAQIRDFSHVDEVASALALIAKSDITGAVNVGSGEPISVAALVTKIGALVGRPDLVRLGARPYSPGDPMFVCANVEKLRTTGWARKRTVDELLGEVIESRRAAHGDVR